MKKPQAKKTVSATATATAAINDSGLKRIMMIVCALFAFALYSNTLNHDFTVDDNTVMKGNKIVTKGPSAIPEIFATAYRKGFGNARKVCTVHYRWLCFRLNGNYQVVSHGLGIGLMLFYTA